MARFGVGARGWLPAAFLASLFLIPPAEAQQPNPDDAALMVLFSARRAYNDRNYPFAIERFKEFLAKYGGHKEAVSARYGMGLVLLEQGDSNGAIEPLQAAANQADFTDRPLALYHVGLAHRALGMQALADSVAKPNEAAQHKQTAQQRFEQAAQRFQEAVKVLKDTDWNAR